MFWRVAGDDGGVESADGDAGEPIGLISGVFERLERADLVGAKGAAALQDEGDFGFGWAWHFGLA